MAVLWDGQSGCGVSDQAFVFETYSKKLFRSSVSC